MSSGVCTNLRRVLESGQFSFTAEIGPPMSGSADNVREKARKLKGCADAANITDNQTAIVRMSSIAAGYIASCEGVEPVIQMTCRDRNRIALQSDLLGAYALGLRNVLILSGDHQSFGNHRASKNVYDVDSVQFLDGVRRMAADGVFMGGSKLRDPVDFFLGATANPFADPEELQLIRLEKKIRAGAKFVQTQGIYDVEKFRRWMERVRERGIHERAYIIAGVVVNKTQKSVEMTALVPGMDIPEHIIRRMRAAEKKDEEGVNIALDLIGEIRTIEGVAGVHVMAIGWESIVATIAKRAGMLPRPLFERPCAQTGG
ncbi:MAG: methylenetetrahydrofolate reductase [Synergistaceae bacterium]|jgi:methylenetetrahydrofolate reductase (NADPH)|nr:methylenetetrahydrofolate reductase [Synergistaceae bacterium]